MNVTLIVEAGKKMAMTGPVPPAPPPRPAGRR